jgi:hypothetical protein
MLGSVRCIQTCLAVPKARSGKLRDRGAAALGTVCPKTPLVLHSQVTDSVGQEFSVLDAHKHMIMGQQQSRTLRPISPFGLNRYAVGGAAVVSA